MTSDNSTTATPSTAKPKRIWLVLVGVALFSTYASIFIPAFVGQPPNVQAISGSLFWTGLFFYLWWRQRERKGWQGALLGVVVGIAMVNLAAFLGTVQERKDNQIFLSQFQNKVSQLKEEEKKINDNFIPSPEKQKDINNNVSMLEDYLKLIDKKKRVYNELTSYMEKYGSRKKDKEIINDVKNLNSDSAIFFRGSEEAINSLLKYYKTGDENWYSKYEKLMAKVEGSEKKCKLSVENLMKKVKY